MKFRKVELKNFRQFYGEQSMMFSTDPDKNVTLIHAENGTGKTAFLNAILWCLFEIQTNNFKDPKNLVNKISKSEGNKNYSVSIEFEDDKGCIFLVQRAFGLNGHVFRVFQVINDSYSEVDKPNSFINSVIPKDMAKYFFFQGEGIGRVSGSKGNSVVKTAVREILGFTIAELALQDIQVVKREYQKSLSNADKSGQLSKLQNEIVTLEEDIERNQSQLDDFEKSIAMYTDKLALLEDKLASSDSAVIKQIHSQRKSTESQLAREKQLLASAEKEKMALVSEFATIVFGFELSTLALDFIDEQEYKCTVPAPYNEQLVTDILKENKCICGSDIRPGTEAFNRIQEMLKQASDPMLERRVGRARSQLTAIKNASTRAKGRFSNNMKMLSDSEAAMSKLKSEIDELTIKIKGAVTLDNIQGLENERNRFKNNLLQDERAAERARISIKNDKKLHSHRKGELNRLDSFSAEMKKYKDLVDYVESVEKVLKSTLADAEKDVEIRIIEKVNKYLEQFVRQDYRAKLNPTTFDIRLVDKNDHIVPESDGQALLLSLTFIASLIELSKERKNAQGQILTPGAIAPFVVDAPFGDLDNKYKGHVAKAIPDAVEQVIFLLSSSHWEGAVEENLRHRVGKEYNMVLEETSEGSGKSEDYISILGTKYETVRYGATVERTVMERVGSYV